MIRSTGKLFSILTRECAGGSPVFYISTPQIHGYCRPRVAKPRGVKNRGEADEAVEAGGRQEPFQRSGQSRPGGGPQQVHRRDDTVVILAQRDYEKLTGKRPGFQEFSLASRNGSFETMPAGWPITRSEIRRASGNVFT
jgi:hypothetical protein